MNKRIKNFVDFTSEGGEELKQSLNAILTEGRQTPQESLEEIFNNKALADNKLSRVMSGLDNLKEG